MLIPTSWLFVRRNESVWMYRPTANDLLIFGPRSDRMRCGFPTAEGVDAYQADLASDLLASGWELLGEGVERRRRPRGESLATPPATPEGTED